MNRPADGDADHPGTPPAGARSRAVQLQQAPVRPGDRVVERFPVRTSLQAGAWAMAAVALLVLVLLGVVGGIDDLPWVVVAGVLLAAFAGAIAWFLFRFGYLAPVLTSSQLLAPGTLTGWNVVDLAGVSGVGLRYIDPHDGQTLPFWDMFVWREDGSRVELEIGREPRYRHQGLGRTEEDRRVTWRYLADTPMGRAAIHIADQVTAVQGADGLLAKDRRETWPSIDDPDEVGFWSPDGQIGRLD